MLADWQDVWHSPQPPFLADSQRLRELNVLILFTEDTSFILYIYYAPIVHDSAAFVNILSGSRLSSEIIFTPFFIYKLILSAIS